MTAATVTEYVDVHDPTVEVVVLTATDNETFTSRKFQVVRAVSATFMDDLTPTAYAVNATVASSNVVTVRAHGITDKKVSLVLYGTR